MWYGSQDTINCSESLQSMSEVFLPWKSFNMPPWKNPQTPQVIRAFDLAMEVCSIMTSSPVRKIPPLEFQRRCQDQGTNRETCCSTVQRSRHLQVLFLVQTVINWCSNLVPAPPMPWSKRGMLQFINWKHTKKSQCWSWKHCLCHQSMCTCQPSSMAKTFLPWSHAAEFHPWYIPWECTNSWTFRT